MTKLFVIIKLQLNQLLRRRRAFLSHTHLTDDVRDGISSFDAAAALRVDPQCHVDVREAFLVWVVLRIFGQSLRNQ